MTRIPYSYSEHREHDSIFTQNACFWGWYKWVVNIRVHAITHWCRGQKTEILCTRHRFVCKKTNQDFETRKIIWGFMFSSNSIAHTQLTLQTWAAPLIREAAQQYTQVWREVIVGVGAEFPQCKQRNTEKSFYEILFFKIWIISEIANWFNFQRALGSSSGIYY